MRGATARAGAFTADWLAHRLPDGGRFVVAWSGGADSTALLGALCELRARRTGAPIKGLRAIHVDHGLQQQSAAWARHCRALARRLGVPLTVRRLRIERRRGESPEAAARDARYDALATELRADETLLLAHHARDQFETLLLQLLRGAGPRGLAAMPSARALGPAGLLRPLLEVEPERLRTYLQQQGLPWVEDPSNATTDLDRNYLRAEVLPRLQLRWPGALRTAARSARLLREADGLLSAGAGRDLARVADGDGLALPLLRRLSGPRLAGVLRAWLTRARVPLPDEAGLAELRRLPGLRADALAQVRWADCVVRRHDERLVLARVAASATPTLPHAPTDLSWHWRRGALELTDGTLKIVADPHGDLDLACVPPSLLVRERVPGRALALDGAGVDVKSLLQEHAVPHWQRQGLPFLHDPRADKTASLFAIADLWLASAVRATPAARRRGRIVWQPK